MTRNWLMWVGCGVMVAVGGYWLWSSGYQNLLGYAVLLLCPLMHLLMHRGHGHSGHEHAHGTAQREAEGTPEQKRPACH